MQELRAFGVWGEARAEISHVNLAPSAAVGGREIGKRIVSSAVVFAVLASLCLVLLSPSSVKVVSASPDTLIYEDTVEEGGCWDSYTKVKSWATDTAGTLRIDFDLYPDEGGTLVYGRIYKNGVAIGTERAATMYQTTFSENIAGWSVGDNIELWTYTTDPGVAVEVNNFRVYSLPPSVPGKPVLVSPENNTSTTDNTPTFTWTGGSNADNHRIEIDNDPDFSSTIDNVVRPLTDNTYTPTNGYPTGTYYWRVWSHNTSGENCSDNTWKFTVVTPAGKPILVSPENNYFTSNTTPTFTWTRGSNADNHRIEVDNDDNWANGLIDNVVIVPSYVPSDNLIYSYDSEIVIPYSGYSEGDEGEVESWTSTVAGTLRISFALDWHYMDWVYGRIYRNGSPVGQGHWGSGTYTENISGWSVGDNIELWAFQGEGVGDATVSNFRIYGSSAGDDNTWTKSAPGYAPGTYYWRVWARNTAGENVSENTWQFTVQAPAEWKLIETWTGTVSAPAQWNLVESWTGTVQAPAEWQLIESWTGTVNAPAQWQIIETWTGTVQAPAQWQLIETWTGAVSAPAEWELIETWTGTISAPAEWQVVESWAGTVSAPAVWQIIESWTGTVSAPTAWHLVESWIGTVQAPAQWQLIETWIGTVEALPAAWQLIESWIGTVEAPRVWRLIETWIGTVKAVGAPDFAISVSPTSGTVQQGSGTQATVTVTSINNYSLTVSLEASSLSSSIIASFSPPSGIPNFNSTMTINVGSNGQVGNHTITITGRGADGRVRTCTYVLTVTAVAPQPTPPLPPPGPIAPTPTQPQPSFYVILSIAVGIAGLAAAYCLLTIPSKYYVMLKRVERAVVRPKTRRIGRSPAKPTVRGHKKVSRAEAEAFKRLERIARERKMKSARKRRR